MLRQSGCKENFTWTLPHAIIHVDNECFLCVTFVRPGSSHTEAGLARLARGQLIPRTRVPKGNGAFQRRYLLEVPKPCALRTGLTDAILSIPAPDHPAQPKQAATE